jgi:formylglycine-generating enzyme required for sulfatase activity
MDIELKKADFLYDESHNLGIKKDDILIPETVEIETLQAGRFEVTRAQFSQFLKETKDIDVKNLAGWTDEGFKAGTGNYPVSGITSDTAQKYCQWLSKKTGSKYRLPKPDEMESWIKEGDGDENTLDYWAGYSLSPDESIEIEEYIKKLEEAGGLILPCGTFGESFHKLYDLKGNVAEICSDGSVKGLSARNISDEKQIYSPPSLLYTGFRVVKE